MKAITAPTRFGTPLARLLLIAVALLGTLFAAAAPASAHAALLGSNPNDGAVVAQAPDDVALTFSEQVAMDNKSIRVLDPKGKRADTAELRNLSKGRTVTYGVNLRPGLANGTYTVAWQAISADSHPVSGAFTFSIGAPSRTTVSATGENVGGGLVGVLYGTARYAAYAGFIVLVGGAAFILACWQRGASEPALQKLVVRGWLTLTAATLALLLLRAPYSGSGHLADAFDLSALKAVLQTKTGASLVSRLLLLGAAALFVAVLFGAYAKRDSSADRDTPLDPDAAKEKKDLTFGLAVGGAVVAAGIAATWALTEHASVGIQPGVAMPVDVLHLLAVATWLGGLTALLVALFRVPAIESAAVRRFSRIAFASVCTLAATGLYQSWRQVGSWSALFGTGYGQLLLVKIGLVGVLIGIAYFSRRWTARLSTARPPGTTTAPTTGPAATEDATEDENDERTGSGEPDSVPADPRRAVQLARQQAARSAVREKRIRNADPHRTGLRTSVLAEAGVAVVLLAVTTVLTTTEPARTEEEAGRTTSAAAAAPAGPVDVSLPFDTGGPKGKGTVVFELTPGRSGSNDLHLYVNNPAGKPYDIPEVKLELTLEAKKIGPLPVVPDHLFTGHWGATGVQVPMAGSWDIAVTVRTSDIDQTTVHKTVKIG